MSVFSVQFMKFVSRGDFSNDRMRMRPDASTAPTPDALPGGSNRSTAFIGSVVLISTLLDQVRVRVLEEGESKRPGCRGLSTL